MIEIARIPNVTAVKQATPDLDQAQRIVDETDLALYAGNDDLVLPFTEIGAVGGICVASHLAGPQIRRMIELVHSGDLDGARVVDRSLRPLYDALAVTTNPIPLKYALNLLGHDVGGLRLPLIEVSENEAAEVSRALESMGLLPAATT